MFTRTCILSLAVLPYIAINCMDTQKSISGTVQHNDIKIEYSFCQNANQLTVSNHLNNKLLPLFAIHSHQVSNPFNTINPLVAQSWSEWLQRKGADKPIDNKVLTALKHNNFIGSIVMFNRQQNNSHNLHVFNIGTQDVVNILNPEVTIQDIMDGQKQRNHDKTRIKIENVNSRANTRNIKDKELKKSELKKIKKEKKDQLEQVEQQVYKPTISSNEYISIPMLDNSLMVNIVPSDYLKSSSKLYKLNFATKTFVNRLVKSTGCSCKQLLYFASISEDKSLNENTQLFVNDLGLNHMLLMKITKNSSSKT